MSPLKSGVFFSLFWVLYEINKRYKLKGIRLRHLHVLYSIILLIFPTNITANFNTFVNSFSTFECQSVFIKGTITHLNIYIDSDNKELHGDRYGEYE